MKALLLPLLVLPAFAGPYQIDDLPLPKGLLPRVGALDFSPDGTLFAVLEGGEVLRATPQMVAADWKWELFAAGFHHGRGIDALSRDQVRVIQRADFTEATDTDQDGTADQYRVFASGWGLSGNLHESQTLTGDGAGGYYLAVGAGTQSGPTAEHTLGAYSEVGRRGYSFAAVQWRGCTLHCDGAGNLTPFCFGFRMPNGIHRDSTGNLWSSDQRGDWRATTALYHLKKGAFYGHPSSLVWDERWPKERDPLDAYRSDLSTYNKHRTLPALQIPHQEINAAAGEPVEIPKEFPHFPGQMLLPDQDGQRITRIMLEKVNGVYQGACTHFLDTKELRSGGHRLRFSPDGQQLYVGQAEGVQRITPEEIAAPFDINSIKILSNGFQLTFSQELKRTLSKEDLNLQSFIYQPRWTHGSKPEDQRASAVSRLEKIGEKVYKISLEDFHPGRVYRLNLNRIHSKDGLPIQNTLFYYTANEVPE